MNATADSGGFLGGSENIGGFGYGVGISIGILLLITTITLASYFCTRTTTATTTATANPTHQPRVLNPKAKYDVFLSFRGADTRTGFTDHLYEALKRAGIHTFRDDNEIKHGEEIERECLQAIEDSKFSVVVLSKGYASSSWCLDELVPILDCRRKMGHGVRPVFYDVDPSHVEEQTGSFADAFEEHEKKHCKDRVDKWKAALKEVSYLKGLDLQKHEA